MPTGATGEHSRGLTKPHFQRSKVADLSFVEDAVEQLLEKIPKDESVTDLQPLLFLLMLDTASQFVLGQSGLVVRIVSGRMRKVIPEGSWRASWKAVHHYVDWFIDRARGKDRRDTDENRILAGLLPLTDNNREGRDHILQAMMAAQDTTAVLIANTLYLLSHHPQVWDVLRKEALALESSGITFNSLNSNQTLRHILYEARRLYPVFAMLGRIALRDTTLPGGGGADGTSPVFVVGGTDIQITFYSLNRDVSVYGEDAEEFRLERWQSISPDVWELMVFGQGPRSCLGQQKALVEASFVLVKLAISSKGLESRDARPFAAAERLTTRNANGCKVAFVPA